MVSLQLFTALDYIFIIDKEDSSSRNAEEMERECPENQDDDHQAT